MSLAEKMAGYENAGQNSVADRTDRLNSSDAADLQIRRMTEADLPAVAALERACFSQPWSEQGFADANAQLGNLFLVAEVPDLTGISACEEGECPAVGCIEKPGKPAECNDTSEHSADCSGDGNEPVRRVAAYCGLYTAADEGEITNVAVAESARGQGIGFSLVTEICRQAAKRGVERIFLEVRRSNTAARRLYKKAGFADCGVRKGFYEFPAEDAVVMVWQRLENEPETPIVKDERDVV